MPWLLEAMKDVINCDKLRGLVVRFDPQISEWGNPPYHLDRVSFIIKGSKPGELKHLSIQRKRKQIVIP